MGIAASPGSSAWRRSCSANASAPKRTVEVPMHSGSASARARTDGSRDRPSSASPFESRMLGTTFRSTAASLFLQAGWAASMAGAESTSRSGIGRPVPGST